MPDRIRTCDLWSRSPTRYPAAPLARIAYSIEADERTVPTLCAYGAYDKVCPFASAGRLIAALEACRAPYDYIEFLHSGHGLQNDGKLWGVYVEKLEAYLERHMASP